MYSIPNLLTMGRMLLIPFIVAFIYIDTMWAAWCALFVYFIASVTDFVDGYVARSMNMESAFGRFLDPVADKVFVGTMLVLLIGFDRLEGFWLIPAMLIIMREFIVSGLREFLGPYNVKFPVTKLAKWKTLFQMFSMGFLIMGDYGNPVLPHTIVYGQVGILIAAVLTLITGWGYLSTGLDHIKKLDEEQS